MYQFIQSRIQAKKDQLKRRFMGPFTYALLAETEQGIFAVDPEDTCVGSALRRDGQYGLDQLESLKPFVHPDSKILVVGAHVGALAVPLARRCDQMVAVEANPVTFKLLVNNLSLNQIQNCVPINIAASDRVGAISFLLSSKNSGGSKRYPIIRDEAYFNDNPKEIQVPGYPLDDYLENRRFDLIIMDIEGSEYFALKGMQRILADAKVLVVEFLPHHLRNVSGVDAKAFVSVIAPHFSHLRISSREQQVTAEAFETVLTEMYSNDVADDGLIFTKQTPMSPGFET